MSRGILAVLLALCCLSVGEAVQCYYCPYGTCVIPTTTTCNFGYVCDTSMATMAASVFGGVSLKGKGCRNIFTCLTSEKETIGGLEYSISHSCCLTSLCNSSASARLSLLSGLVAVLALLLTKVL